MIARLLEFTDIADEVRHFVFEADCNELDFLAARELRSLRSEFFHAREQSVDLRQGFPPGFTGLR